MDPVSHLIFGRALAALIPRPPVARGLTAAIVIGSIAPDIDCVLMPTGWDRYLLWHQRGTHALIGTAADALALAALMWGVAHLLDRRRSRQHERGSPSPSPSPSPTTAIATTDATRGADTHVGEAPAMARFPHLWLAAWIGCLGHITLDLVSGGTIRLLEPFSAMPFGLPLTAMADPLLALPLIAFFLAALIWKRHAPRLAMALLCVLAGVLAVKAVSERAARRVYAASRVSAPGSGSIGASIRASAGAAAGAAVSGSAGGSVGGSVDGAVRGSDGTTAGAELRAIEARWGSVSGWMFYTRTPTAVQAWSVDAWTGAVSRTLERSTIAPPADAALIAASRRLDTVRNFSSLFDLTFVETRRNGSSVDVLWTDIRFCGGDLCPLWFGGTFESDGRPREQIVLIGAVRQARPIAMSPPQ